MGPSQRVWHLDSRTSRPRHAMSKDARTPNIQTLEPCPSDEVLAAFVDDELEDDERDDVEKHLSACLTCYEVFSGTLRAVKGDVYHPRNIVEPAPSPARADAHFTRPRTPWRALLLAAAAASAVGAALLALRTGTPVRSDIAALVKALEGRRTVEPRLTGGFPHAEAPAILRGPTAPSPAEEKSSRYPLFAAAADLQRKVKSDPTAVALGNLGVADLILGHPAVAVQRLEEATAKEPKNARLLSDLSAAYLVRAKEEDQPEDIPKALEMAARAAALDPSLAEAVFNRALALEALSLKGEAIRIWEEYLVLDATSGWADEARRRRDALRAEPNRSDVWKRERERLLAAAKAGDTRVVREAVDGFTQESRELVEMELLPQWAAAQLAGRAEEARERLEAAGRVAEAHKERTTDGLLFDTVTTIERARGGVVGKLAEGHQAFRDGRALYDEQEFLQAQPLFERAVELLEAGRSPFASAAGLSLASVRYYVESRHVASDAAQPIAEDAKPKGQLSLWARASLMAANGPMLRGDMAAALEIRLRALRAFQATNEHEFLASTSSMLAQNLDYLGDLDGAWSHRVEAMRLIGVPKNQQARYTLLQSAAVAASRQELPWTALGIQAEASRTAEAWARPVALTESQLHMARIEDGLGLHDEAARNLQAARQHFADVHDEKIAQRLLAELNAAEGELSSTQDTPRAGEALAAAISYFQDAGMPIRLPQLLLTRGRRSRQAGDNASAERDFLLGIEHIEHVVRAQGRFQIAYFDKAWALYGELIRLYVESGRAPDAALAVLERSLARELLAKADLPTLTPAAIRARLPVRTALVYYVILPDRLLIWLLDGEGARHYSSPITADRLGALVTMYRTTIQRGSSESEAESLSAALYDALIAPIRSVIRHDRLVFVPDGVLHGCPFAALRPNGSARYLIEDHAISVAPSGTLFVNATAEAAGRTWPARPSVLVFGDPAPSKDTDNRFARLPGAKSEAEAIAALYPHSELVIARDATAKRLLDRAPAHDIIHFAGHAVPNAVPGQPARLLLAGAEAGFDPATIDADRFANTKIVVLAACGTATGPTYRGEGVLSLARPFLAANVPAVVASLWPVDDASSGPVLTRFHAALLQDEHPQSALRKAQLALLADADPALRSPRSWAIYELLGGVNPP